MIISASEIGYENLIWEVYVFRGILLKPLGYSEHQDRTALGCGVFCFLFLFNFVSFGCVLFLITASVWVFDCLSVSDSLFLII